MTHESIALVDLSYLFRKRWHAQTQDAEINSAAAGVLEDLARVRDSVGHVILCVDAPPYFRKEIDPQYKANREAPSDGLLQQMRWLKERVDADGYQIARAQGFEADDIIATLAVTYRLCCDDVRIVGPDKDLAQLVNGKVRMFVPAVGDREEQILDGPAVMEKYGVPPPMIADWLALQGDKSDNIPGCPGVGAKRAADVIREHGSLEKLFENLSESVFDRAGGLKKWEEAILDNREQIERSRQLVELRTDAPIDADALLLKKEQKRLSQEPASPPDDGDVDDADEPSQVVAAPVELVEPPKEEPKPELAPLAKGGANPSWNIQLQPRGLKGVAWVAHTAWNSRRYSQFQNEETLIMAIMRGRELGIPCTTALDSFHVVEGKLYASAQLIIGMAQSHADCVYFMCTESTPKQVTWECMRRGWPKPMSRTFTLEQAEEAGLLKPTRTGKPSNYTKHPEDMLSKACGAKLARYAFADRLLGLVSLEEIGEVPGAVAA